MLFKAGGTDQHPVINKQTLSRKSKQWSPQVMTAVLVLHCGVANKSFLFLIRNCQD